MAFQLRGRKNCESLASGPCSGSGRAERSSTALLFLVYLADRQSRLSGDHLDEHVAGCPGQLQRVQPLPDLDALARIFDGRRLGFELAIALGRALLRRTLHFIAMVRGASGPYSIVTVPGAPAADARPSRTSSGEPANVPGVWVQSGSSAIRSPLIP